MVKDELEVVLVYTPGVESSLSALDKRALLCKLNLCPLFGLVMQQLPKIAVVRCNPSHRHPHMRVTYIHITYIFSRWE